MISIIVASLSAYCVRACKIKHFTEREFSGIFSLAGGGFCVFKTGIPGGHVWVRAFTDSDLPDTDNIVPFEYTTPINQSKRTK